MEIRLTSTLAHLRARRVPPEIHLDGRVDDLRIYDHALDDSEIATLHNAQRVGARCRWLAMDL